MSEPGNNFFGKEAKLISAPGTFFGEEAQIVTPVTSPLKQVVQDIASKYDVPQDILESYGRGLGALELAEGPLQKATAAAGRAGEALTSGLPSKLVAKGYGLVDPKYEKAFDELKQTIEERKTTGEKVAETVLSLAAPAGIAGAAAKALPAAKAAAGAVSGLVTGGLAGFGQSTRENEAQAIVTGMGLGTVLGAGAGKVQKWLAKPAKEAVERELPNIEKGAQEILDKQAPEISTYSEALRVTKPTDYTSFQSFQKNVPEEVRAGFANNLVDDEQVDLVLRNPQFRTFIEQLPGEDVSSVAKEVIAFNKIKGEMEQLAGRVGASRGKQLQALEKYITREGADDAVSNYIQMKQLDAGIEYINREGVKELTAQNTAAKWAKKFLDYKMVADVVDTRYGLGISPELDDVSKNLRKASSAVYAAREQAKKSGLTKRLNEMSTERRTALYDAVDKGKENLFSLSDEERKTLDLVKEHFDFLANSVESLGKLKIKKRADYIPHMLVDFPQYIVNVKKQSNELLSRLKVQDWKDVNLSALKESPEIRDFITAVKLGSNAPVRTGAELSVALREALKPSSVDSVMSKAGMLFERQGEIPDFVREKDIRRLMGKYHKNAYRHIFLRSNLRKLNDLATQIAETGDGVAADQIRSVASDLLGIRQGTLAKEAQNLLTFLSVKAREAADKANRPVTKWMWESAEAAPAILGSISNNVYSAFLGLSPRAFIRNLSQPFVMTAPEIAGADPKMQLLAQQLAAKNFLKSIGDITQGRSLSKQLLDEGYVSSKFIDAGAEYMRRGIQQSWSGTADALNKLADWSMVLYTGSDVLNRHVTLGMANDLSDLLLKGHPGVVRFITRIPKTYQNRINRAMDVGDEKGLRRTVADYLISNTQFNYDRANMMEAGRSLGRLFTIFTKWPAAVAGDIYKKTATGQTDAAMLKYLGPLVFLYMLDSQTPDKVRRSDRYQNLVGKGGFTSWAPGLSIKSMATGDFMSPPIWQTARRVQQGVTTQNIGVLHSALNEAAQSFLPGSAYVRFFTDDLPTYIEGRRPRGPFLERAQRQTKKAIRKLKKGLE